MHVTIGGQRDRDTTDSSATGYVPGGFAKFFNRVIDAGIWAQLPDAARAVYLPLVRLADGRGPFRVRAGLACLMKHSGLSRSSVKRGLKALQDSRLIVVVDPGGVGPDNINRANCYELLVPEPRSESSIGRSKATTWSPAAKPSAPVHKRTPSRAVAGPTQVSPADRPVGPALDPPAVHGWAEPGAGDGPLLRNTYSNSSPEQGGQAGSRGDGEMEIAAKSLLRWGFEPAEAGALAAEHGPVKLSRALAEARQLQAVGRLRSATGFLRWAIAEAKGDERAPAQLVAWPEVEARNRRQAEAVAQKSLGADDDAVDALDDSELEDLAAVVRQRYLAHPAMLRLLTARPPRQSRLMRAEIVRILHDSTSPAGGL